MKEEICKHCGEPVAIRNPSGNCDHLYYPENVNKGKRADDFLCKYLKFKEKCINAQIFDIDEIIKLYEVWLHVLE